ncbi:DNA internalization-related competence protein ComEC/Rec2 [hydrothermal vent metagenome]|uniref:DNA internalization-related competence protein ComEC/Rec2 n=1 Tax=hydrothermal vent metagenome TaxID=652676 RepID=A0A3B0TF26_9ZZZZ
MAVLAAGIGGLAARLDAEQDRWFLWSPVMLGAGIGFYFVFEHEPAWWLAALPLIVGCAMAWRVGAARALAFALSVAVAVAGLGLVAAKTRSELVWAPKLDKKLGPVMVEGWVEALEPRGSGRVSALIQVVRIERLAAVKTPARVRLTMSRGMAPERTGVAIKVLAMLRPPPRPVAPGAYDFSRRSWFRQIGAYGHTLSRPGRAARIEAAGRSWSAQAGAWIDGIRAATAARVMTIAGQKGGPVAAALLTGLRGGIPKADLRAIRDAGLAHLLAISGLHMALMSGAAFWVVRALIAAMPWLALRVVGKKWAAGVGIFTGFIYFFLAGGSVATERAFIMVAVALVAVMVDRPAISLRNVALAALIILAMKPESLIEAGFQMSFAAVVALTAFYERVRHLGQGDFAGRPGDHGDQPWSAGRVITKTLIGVLVTTLVASLATSPLAAFQFNRVAVYGLASNLIAVPLVGFAIMPLGLLALVTMPFGLDGPALALMGMGTGALVEISRAVAGWPGAAALVASPPAMVLPILGLGGLWLCLWRGSWRYWGLVPIALAVVIAGLAPPPDIYVDEDGARVAVRADDGRLTLSKARGARYPAAQWLRRNADPRKISAATAAPTGEGALICDPRACAATLNDARGTAFRFAYIRHPAAISEECRGADIVVAKIPLNDLCIGPAIVIDRTDLKRAGAHAIRLGRNGPQVTTVLSVAGDRPWTRAYRQR